MIMKTSKKLLSFFLAVVMVITTCSVGFTAFAKDYDNIWTSDNIDAETAFDSLNGLADDNLPAALMGIEAISGMVYQKYASENGIKVSDLTPEKKSEIVKNTTLQDILYALQPTLIGALAGESQEAYAERLNNRHTATYYDYLKKDDGSLDFYTLYALCDDYENNDSLSSSTKNTLKEWKTELNKIYNIEVTDAAQDAIDKLKNDFDMEDPMNPGEKLYLQYTNLNALETYYANSMDSLDADTQAGIMGKFEKLTEDFKNYGAPSDFEITTLGQYMYYTYSENGQLAKYAFAYHDTVNKGGDKVAYTLTPENTADGDPLGFGLGTVSQNTPSTEDLTINNLVDFVFSAYDMTKESFLEIAGIPAEMAPYALSTLDDMAVKAYCETIIPANYTSIVKGLAVKYGNTPVTGEEIDKMVADAMPVADKNGDLFTESEIKNIGSMFTTFNIGNSDKDLAVFFKNSKVKATDRFGAEIDWALPSNVNNNFLSKYLAMVAQASADDRDQGMNEINSARVKYLLEIKSAFYSNLTANTQHYIDNDGNLITNQQIVNDPTLVKRDAQSNLPCLAYTENTAMPATYNMSALDPVLDDAERYAYGMAAADYLGDAVKYTRDPVTAIKNYIDYKAVIDAKTPQPEEIKPVLNDEQKAILYADYNLTGEMGAEIVNVILNDTILPIITPNPDATGFNVGNTISELVNGLVTTNIDLVAIVTDLWQRICANPIQTIFELVPVLTVVIDEFLLPLVFNSGKGEGIAGVDYDKEGGILHGLLIDFDLLNGVMSLFGNNSFSLHNYTYDYGSYVGITGLGWDLNELLPDLMHWLTASKADQQAKNVAGIDYYVNSDTTVPVYYNKANEETQDFTKTALAYEGVNVANADFKNYDIKDADGNKVTATYDDKDRIASFSYNGRSANVTYPADLADTATDEEKEAYNASCAKAVSEAAATVIGAQSETEFASYMTYEAKVPDITGIYMVDLALSNARVGDMGKLLAGIKDDSGNPVLSADIANGLGEIVIELATLFTEAIDEYMAQGLDSQTRYKKGDILFSGLNNVFVALPQLIDIIEDLAADKYGTDKSAWTFCYDGKITDQTDNANLTGSTVNAPLELFKSYAGSNDSDRAYDILDGFVGLVIEDWLNAVISLFNNVITTDNVITQNLPIVTGLLQSLDGFGENSIFTDILNSVFQLKRSDENSFTFEKQPNGFTGLSNKNAYFLFSNIDTLVNVIMSLVDSINNKSASDTAQTTGSSAAALISSFAADKAKAAPATTVNASGFTTEELADVDNLITKLDEMISSLLSDSSINGYGINTTGNIASGLVSLLSNYIASDDAESAIGLLDKYLYYLNGADQRIADENGDLKANEVYTNKNLTDIVVRTFALVETLSQNLLKDYDYVTGEGDQQKTYNLIAQAISGVVSPDSIGIRLASDSDQTYQDAQDKILNLKSWNSAIENDAVSVSIDWNITAGDKDAFFDGLAASLRLVTSILSVLFIDAGVYQNALEPIFSTIGDYVGFEVADTVTNGDEVFLGIVKPIVAFLDKFLAAPANTLIKTVQALAYVLDDTNDITIASIVSNTITPIANELTGISNILKWDSTTDKLGATSPTLAAAFENLTVKINEQDVQIIKYIRDIAKVENNQLVNLKIKDLPLCGANIIPIINTLIESVGIQLGALDWKALSQAATPADALAYFIEYVVDSILNSDIVDNALGIAAIAMPALSDIITAIHDSKINGKALVKIILKVLNVTQNPTLFAWSFEKYLQEAIEGFAYPLGLTKNQADEAATDIDAVINNIFPLLQSLGINLGGSNLKDILKNNLFTNKLLTTLSVELYGALNSNETVATVLSALGIKASTTDVAALLTDTSYGATYTTAADAIKAKANWSDLKTVTKNDKGEDVTTYADINWGFADGSANAHQGFVNALAAILRPVNDVLAVFLNTGDLTVGSGVYDLITSLEVAPTTSGDVTYELKNGIFKLTVVDADNAGSKPSEIKLDLTSLDALKNLAIKGTNGYNSAIIPLLEAFQCTGIVSEAQFKADVAAAKDNLLLDVLNPILGSAETSLVNKIVASPVVTIATLLPSVSAYLDASGLSQAVTNLLAPVADIVYSVNDVVSLNSVVAALLGAAKGQSLADCVAEKLGMQAGSVKLDLGDIASINLEDMIIPILNSLLLKQYNITLTNINWNALISLGTRTTYTSLATDLSGNALTGKTVKDVDYGKVLITVLRYVFNNVIANADSIKSLIMNIVTDEKTGAKLSDNATVAGILNNVFTQLKTHTADQIIVGLYYFFVGDNVDAYWNYSNYKTKTNTFKFPEGVSNADVTKLIAFLDGIIEEIDLNALISDKLYTDSIVNALAKLIYTNIEKTKISDSIMLGDLLEIAHISTDSKTVVAMLSDSKYGETAQFKTAATAINNAGSWAKVDFDKLTWGVKDQETFLKALVAILRPFEGLLDVLLADGQLNLLEGITIPGSNDYVNSIVPLLEAFRCEGIKSYDKYLADKNKAYDNLLLDVLNPLFGFVNKVVANPIETIASVLPNVALFIGNDGLVQFVKNLITPIAQIIQNVNPIIDVDKLLAELTKVPNISITNIDKFIEPFVGGGNLIALANKYLAAIGIQIPEIDWLALASLGTVKNENSAVQCIGQRIVVDGNSSQVLIAVLRYVLNVAISNQVAIKGLLGKSYTGALKDILDMVFKMTPDKLLKLIFSLVNLTQSPTEVYWAYNKYKSEYTKFKYPNGITADDAERAVGQLDGAVTGVMSLLQGLGVVDASDLSGVVNGVLFKNELLTQLAVTLYGALDTDKIAPYLGMAGIAVSPKAIAKILTDTSYGKTYKSAAKVLSAKSSWSKLKTVKTNKDGSTTTTYASINWGFKNGAANAQQGFVNALVAIFRPFIDILGPFLNGSDLALGDILYGIVTGLDIKSGDEKKGEKLTIFKNGKLTIKEQTNGVYSTSFEMDFSKVETLKTLNLFGSNGYENSIIPLLDVLQVENSEIKSFDQYVKDCKKAKDNVLLDVLNPLMSFINRVLEAPFDTITSVLPNLAYFIDNNGIGQLLDNLLSPVTEFLKNAKKDGLDVDKIIKAVAGKDLGKLLTDLLKLKNVKLKVSLTNLDSLNIQDYLVPIINSLLKDTGIKLPDFKWSTIASHGDVVTSASKAENSQGKFTNKEVIADKGETLVAVLRYIAQTLITNAKSLKSLLGSIDAIKKNDTIKSVINSVFNTISTSSKDGIVLAVFYFLCGEPTNAFWDYTAYETGEYKFSYPEGIDVDFLKNLPPMLDGLIGGLVDLNGLIGENLFTDELVSKLATGLYGAIEGVSINDNTNLAQLLAKTDIDFTTDNVAKLLVDKDYGKSYPGVASVISNAGSWANVNAGSLNWGVTDRDSFFHALVAVLRPIYGVLDVLLNDASLGIFDIVRIPGSNGYTSSIVPLMEAFSMYNVKTQYQYREDIVEEYDNILLDIINPLWDKIEDLLNAPLQTLAAMIPNLALFIGNDGLCQIIDNLLTPVSALVDAIKPVVNLNDLLSTVLGALNVDLGSLLGKIGITNFSLDLYDLNATLKPLLGGDAIIPLLNNVLGLIKIGGQPLGIKLNPVDWLQLASHGKTIVSASQAATYGSRIFVEGDSSETLIAVLRYLVETVNAGDNFSTISSLIAGLLGDGVSDNVSDIIDQVLGMLQGDTDEVIASLVDLLQTLA